MPGKQKIRPDKGVEGKAPSRLYTLVVCLSSEGPVSDEFEGTIISRTIQIRGDQTLEDLHKTIFEAYDRSMSISTNLCWVQVQMIGLQFIPCQ